MCCIVPVLFIFCMQGISYVVGTAKYTVSLILKCPVFEMFRITVSKYLVSNISFSETEIIKIAASIPSIEI